MGTRVRAEMDVEGRLSKQAKWAAALRKLREAQRLLDEANAPGELGARLDHVINSLEKAIHRSLQSPG